MRQCAIRQRQWDLARNDGEARHQRELELIREGENADVRAHERKLSAVREGEDADIRKQQRDLALENAKKDTAEIMRAAVEAEERNRVQYINRFERLLQEAKKAFFMHEEMLKKAKSLSYGVHTATPTANQNSTTNGVHGSTVSCI